MRKHNTSTGAVIYPNDVSYAFSPMGVRVQDSSTSFTQLAVSIYGDDGQLYTLMRVSPYNGEAVIDLSGVAQAMFDVVDEQVNYATTSVSGMAKHIRIELEYAGTSFSFTTMVVWGGVLPYSAKGKNPTAIYRAEDYPCAATFILEQDEKAGSYTPSAYPAMVNMPIPADVNVVAVAGVDIPVKTIPPVCRNPYYLRWVDEGGRWCHYLFDGGKVQIKTKDYGESITGRPLLPEYTNDRYVARRQQGKTIETSLELYTTMADSALRDYLSSLLASPLVDLYDRDNDGWIAVTVSAGTTNISTMSYDDFAFTIDIPTVETQKL